MNITAFIIIGILFFICIALLLKIFLIKKSIKEIEKSFNHIMQSDTNSILTISSSDKSARFLATSINRQLKDFRKEKLQYKIGNEDLKKSITNISHDLRTPLMAITGYVDLMKSEQLSTNQEKYLKIIDKKSNELAEITGQLFDFSKTIDNIEMKKENCCINELLEETLISYYAIFKEKKIVPNVLICEKKIYRIVNKISVLRIFENILSNVIKYSDGIFKVELKENGILIFQNKANSLDTTTVQKIFNRYFSVENAKESTGIGLSIAKQLVELNNWKIEAKYLENNLIIEINI